MSIAITSILKNSNGSWSFSWADAGASFYRVVLLGEVLQNNPSRTYTWNDGVSYLDFPPPIEVAYEKQLVQSELFSPILIVQWYGERTANEYEIQQTLDSGTTWTKVDGVLETKQWVYTFLSKNLIDRGTVYYRVVAIDEWDNESIPRHYTRYVVTPPLPPDGNYKAQYAAGNIVISAI